MQCGVEIQGWGYSFIAIDVIYRPMTSTMGGRPVIYVDTETKQRLSDIVWEHRFKTYNDALRWVLDHQVSNRLEARGVK